MVVLLVPDEMGEALARPATGVLSQGVQVNDIREGLQLVA
jgi:hypothetical protein